MMPKIVKNEKGSISLFVLLSALFFLVVVTSVGISFKNKEASIDSQFEITKASYEKDIANKEQIYAEESKKHIVSFDANGGTVNVESKLVVEGNEYGELPIPTREGYVFKGWNGKNKFSGFYKGIGLSHTTGIQYNNEKMATTDFIEINFEENQSYYLSGLTNTLRSYVSAYGENKEFLVRTGGSAKKNLTIKNDSFTLDNTNLEGNIKYIRILQYEHNDLPGIISEIDSLKVQLEEGSTATEYEPYYVTDSTKVTQTKDHTLTAIWEPEYTVSFNANLFDAPAIVEDADGLQVSYDKNTSIITINGTSTSTYTKTRLSLQDNFSFVENEEYITTLEQISGTCTGNSTVGIVADVRTSTGASISPRNNNRVNIIPFGRNNIPILTINESSATQGGALEFWIWFNGGKNTYTFDNCKVKINFTKIENKKVIHNDLYGELPTPTKNNYQFDGWYTGENGTGTRIESTSVVQITEDTTLYAKWIENN